VGRAALQRAHARQRKRTPRPPRSRPCSITYDLFNAADEQHENICLAAAVEGVDFMLLDDVVRPLVPGWLRCVVWAAPPAGWLCWREGGACGWARRAAEAGV
jgi:hypothetical protein